MSQEIRTTKKDRIWLEIAEFDSVSVSLNLPGLVHQRYITCITPRKRYALAPGHPSFRKDDHGNTTRTTQRLADPDDN